MSKYDSPKELPEEIQQNIRDLSDRIVKAQQPIRILDALKWGPEIQADFFKNKFRQLPMVNAEYYQTKDPLTYDPEAKKEEFYEIERAVRRELGQFSGVGKIMTRMCREYREVIRMLEARGKPEFSEISQELYGGSRDVFYAGSPTVNDLAVMMTNSLINMKEKTITEEDEKKYTSEEAVQILNQRLNTYFEDPPGRVRVKLSDGILADSSAGSEVIKIRNGAKFSERELKAFEVHEGWVHLATGINGQNQPLCTFLSKGAPSSTQTQEGLATVMEIFTFTSYPGRVMRITDRVTAIYMAEQGANFIDIFHFFRERGNDEESSYNSATRVFRGSAPDKGPFTKDLSYSRGFVFTYNYIHLAIEKGLLNHIPLLFAGKVALEDISVLDELLREGILTPPKHVPPQFKDLASLSAWMSYTLFLNRLDFGRIASEYKQILVD